MNLQRGFRDKLEKYFDINQDIDIIMNTYGNSVYDYCCFGVDSSNRLSDDRYMIFYNQTSSPYGEIRLNGSSSFRVSLRNMPPNICKLVFTVSIDGNGTMGNISSHSLRLSQNGNSALELNLSGNDFHSEKAVISIEIYKKDTWRIGVIAGGFNGGLKDLLKFYGGTEISAPKPAPAPAPVPNPIPAPAPEPVRLKKVELKKGQKVNLVKSGNTLGEILINLNWSQPKKSFFSAVRAIDLDLGCLYEMKDGRKGSIQALGNNFGSLERFPYIAL
ncbi:MAG TPA: tellurium resistance protein, partial [Ruminococcus sp.]|nr:tellurium resistance protein [Ruminococcus sp.]